MDSVIAVISPIVQTVDSTINQTVQNVVADVSIQQDSINTTIIESIQLVNASVVTTPQNVIAVISEVVNSANVEHIELELKMTSSLFRFKEFTYNLSGDITTQDVWNSELKETKYYTINYTYSSGNLTNIEIERISDGFTYNKSLTYDINGNLISINII